MHRCITYPTLEIIYKTHIHTHTLTHLQLGSKQRWVAPLPHEAGQAGGEHISDIKASNCAQVHAYEAEFMTIDE